MFNLSIILLGKLTAYVSKLLNLGQGSTWPGHIALNINKNFIRDVIKHNPNLKIILIAGTNGKTTTCKLIHTILEKSGNRIFQNESGANLLNGIASSMLLHSDILSTISYDYAIFEADENTLPLALKEFTPNYLVILNLFRDQLDRYGEVNTIAFKWKKSIDDLSKKTKLILNADDPQVASLGIKVNSPLGWNRGSTLVYYFGLKGNKSTQAEHQQHAVDSTYCPNCEAKLYYHSVYYSHLGDWECKNCGFKRPKNIYSTPPQSKLVGIYNLYNILPATLTTKQIGISDDIINKSLKIFAPAFGRQEILKINGKRVQIFLSKNPTSFNESLRTISNLKAKNVLLVLNDRIPDGRDVSWIWDVDFEDYVDKFKTINISGDRCYDMGLRIKYAIQNYKSKVKINENLKEAVAIALALTPKTEKLYVLPTYSAMLEVRKVLTGRKIGI